MKSIPKTLCAGCGKYFASTSEFGAHLTGGYGPNKPPRRHKTDEEMKTAGFTSEERRVAGQAQPAGRTIWYRGALRAKNTERFSRRSPEAGKGIVASAVPDW